MAEQFKRTKRNSWDSIINIITLVNFVLFTRTRDIHTGNVFQKWPQLSSEIKSRVLIWTVYHPPPSLSVSARSTLKPAKHLSRQRKLKPPLCDKRGQNNTEYLSLIKSPGLEPLNRMNTEVQCLIFHKNSTLLISVSELFDPGTYYTCIPIGFCFCFYCQRDIWRCEERWCVFL